MNRTAIVGVVCLTLLVVFAAIAVSVVNGRRPLEGDLTRSFRTAVRKAAGGRAAVVTPHCQKTSVQFFACQATVNPRRRPVSIDVSYNVWLDDDGCWDTARRSKEPQSPELGRLRARFYALRGCLAR